jgi:hypothetical protein
MTHKTLKELMGDAELRAHLIKDTGISEDDLQDALIKEYVLEILKEKFEVFKYATDYGHCEVIEWHGYYFSGSEWDVLSGPYLNLDAALDPIRYLLECGDESDTESATHFVDSKWPDKQTFEIIRRLVSIDDFVEVNGAKYRRTKSGYVEVPRN